MRKAIYLGAALAAVITTSCSSDMDQFEANRGDGNVVVRLQLPDNFATRSFGDGQTPKRLQYAVYQSNDAANSDGEKTAVIEDVATFNGLTATVNLQLVNGQTYDFVFWADVPNGSPYTFDSKKQTVTVSYEDMAGNDENRDAFFGQLTGQTITGPTSLSATLKRPFAQINLGTSDFDTNAVGAAYPDFKSSMTISTKLPTTLNLLDGSVDDEVETVVTNPEARPHGETFPVEGFEYVSMNYILVDANKGLVNLEYSFKNGENEITTLPLSSVPVQRNYRTNIYGAVLTSPTDINITIDPIFTDPDYNNAKVVSTPEEFVDALKNKEIDEIVVTEPVDLTDVDEDDMVITTPKVLDLTALANTRAGEYALTIDPQKPFDIKSSLTINGGTITNGQEEFEKGVPVSMFHVRKDGELNLNGVTIDGNMEHHWHGTTATGLNSAVIDYWHNAVINITDSHIVGGMYVLCGMGGTQEAKVTCTNSYLESTSSVTHNRSNWAYAFRARGQVYFKDCTVKGVQGGVSPDGAGTVVTFDGGTYYTQNSEGNEDAFYAVYATNGATAVINSGYFYGANKRSATTGTAAIVCGDNDNFGAPIGYVIINGGFFSGNPYTTVMIEPKKSQVTPIMPAEGLQFKAIDETVDGRKYLWTVEKAEESEEPAE